MADETKVIISIESILRGLDKTLRGLAQVEKQLKAVASVKVGGQTTAQGFDKAALAATRLQQQQKRLEIQATTLANREERARQMTERLARSRDNLTKATERAANAERRTTERTAREVQRIQRQTEVQARRNERERTRAARTIADVETREAKRGANALIRTLQQQGDAAQQLTRRLSGLGNSLRSIGQGAAQIGLTLSAAVTAPIVALGVGVTRAAVSLDSLTKGLTAITGSSQEAATQLVRLEKIARLPGIGFEEAIQGSIRLQAVGFSAAEAEASLVQFANAIALTGGGRDELARVTVQLGQLAAKGKVLSQDLRPIIEAAPAVGRALLEAFGTVNADDIQELGLSSREFLGILVDQLSKLPRAAAGAKNAFENFRDTVFRAAATIGQSLLPVLTDLVDKVAPIITTLANAFSSLPAPIRAALVVLVALSAAVGPLTFIFGQVTTGVGRLLVGLVQLNATGILPTIANFRLLGQVMVGTASLAQGAGATAAAAAVGWGALGIAIAGVVALAAGIAFVTSSLDKATAVEVAAAAARIERLKTTKAEVAFLEELAQQVSLTAAQQESLEAIYNNLTGAARGRVAVIDDETKKLQGLIEAKRQQIALDTFAAQATNVALVRAVTVALAEQRAAQEKLTEAKKDFENATIADITASGKVIRFAEGTKEALDAQTAASERANTALDELAKTKGGVEAAAAAIIELSEATGISTETILKQAEAGGIDAAEIDKVREALKDFSREQRDAAPNINTVTKALLDQAGAFIALGRAAKDVAKTDEEVIRGMLSHFAATAKTRAEFDRLVDDALKRFPELQGALDRLRRSAGFDDAFGNLIGKTKKGPSGTGLRNAQEQLARALADLTEASALEQEAVERRSNERKLQENENAFRLQLKSLREYLTVRAALTNANINLEIAEQRRIVTEAEAVQRRAAERLSKKLPAAERVRVQAGATEAEERQIAAQTKINDLLAEQAGLQVEARQALAEASKQQLEDIRALEIEYAELKGSIEDALNAASDEKFRDSLLELGKAQDDINKRLQLFGDILSAEQKQELELARAQNQRQIDAIQNIIRQERALNRLAAINEFLNRAKDRQSELERQIANDVDFRGLSEEQAIARRLAGEEKVKASLLVARDIAQDTVDQLRAAFGQEFPVPQALLDFIRQVNLEVQSLGKLTFTEQFRLAEKEFNRIQDELANAISDVERRIRSRDLAEVQGALVIRRLNGEKVEALEKQAAILEAIAKKSNDEALRRQAAAARQTTKDIRAAAEETENFNRQLASVSVDALHSSLSQLFRDLRDNTENVLHDILNFFNNILDRVNDFIGENLAREITESLFPSGREGEKEGGVIGFFKRVLGLGGGGEGETEANTLATDQNTAAINALTGVVGGTPATGSTGGGAGSRVGQMIGFLGNVASIIAGGSGEGGEEAEGGGGTDFGNVLNGLLGVGAAVAPGIGGNSILSSMDTVIQLLQQILNAVSSGSGSQGGSLGSFAGLFAGEAATGMYPAVPGGAYKFVEGGYPEAVLTTDPRYASRQLAILREYLHRTKGLFGRVPEFASGGFVSAREAEINLLSTIQRGAPASASVPDAVVVNAGGGGDLHLRQIIVDDERRVGDYLNSAQGEHVLNTWLYRNAHKISRIGGR